MSIYEPLLMLPKNETRDMLLSQIFSATVQGSMITDYQLRIYNNDTNALLYDSTKTNLTTSLYNNQVLSHTVPITAGMATVRDLKWTLQIWNSTETVTSRENFFYNYTTPTVSLTPTTINTQSYTFIATHTQAQNVPVERFKFTLYDSTQQELNNSDWQFNGSVIWLFDGFISGNTYYVKCELYNAYGVYAETGLVEYNVSYTQPSVNITPVAENLFNESAIKVVFSGVFDNVGSSSGTISYVDDRHTPTGKALQLETGATAMWSSLKIRDVFTDIFVWIPLDNGFTGRIKILENTVSGKYFEIGYDGDKFYFDINGIIIYTVPFVLSTTKKYLFIVTNNNVIVKSS